MDKEQIEELSNDLAFHICNHSFEEVSEPETLAEIIKKYLIHEKSMLTIF